MFVSLFVYVSVCIINYAYKPNIVYHVTQTITFFLQLQPLPFVIRISLYLKHIYIFCNSIPCFPHKKIWICDYTFLFLLPNCSFHFLFTLTLSAIPIPCSKEKMKEICIFSTSLRVLSSQKWGMLSRSH